MEECVVGEKEMSEIEYSSLLIRSETTIKIPNYK
jgi:hypothetical protein